MHVALFFCTQILLSDYASKIVYCDVRGKYGFFGFYSPRQLLRIERNGDTGRARERVKRASGVVDGFRSVRTPLRKSSIARTRRGVSFIILDRPVVNATRINDVTDRSEIARVHSTGVKTPGIRL